IVESPAEGGSNGAVRMAQELAAADPRYVMLFQYANEANPRAHYDGTGAEIVRDLSRVDALVAGLGTGGTLMGTSARLREAFPEVVVAAAEPHPGDLVMGLRSLEDGYVPPILDVSKLDRKSLVASPRNCRQGRSSSACSPTAAGSTFPPTSGRRRTWRRRWSARSGGSPGRDPRRVARTRSGGGAERVLRLAALPRRRRRALRAGAQQARVAVPVRARGRSRGLVRGGRGLRARRLPLAPGDGASPLAHRPRAGGAMGGPG